MRRLLRSAGTLAARGYLRSAEYHRQSYFFLRHNLADDHTTTSYSVKRILHQALPYLPFQAEALSIPFSPVPMSRDTCSAQHPIGPSRRPTALFTGGFDGTAEELHSSGARIAIEFGWNVVAWDGPGQAGCSFSTASPCGRISRAC